MSKLLNTYFELNLNNYDEDDVAALNSWAIQAYDELENLTYRLEKANKRLSKINDLAEEQ